jgi:hypothetical protein
VAVLQASDAAAAVLLLPPARDFALSKTSPASLFGCGISLHPGSPPTYLLNSQLRIDMARPPSDNFAEVNEPLSNPTSI